jgi:hypothetical protein
VTDSVTGRDLPDCGDAGALHRARHDELHRELHRLCRVLTVAFSGVKPSFVTVSFTICGIALSAAVSGLATARSRAASGRAAMRESWCLLVGFAARPSQEM